MLYGQSGFEGFARVRLVVVRQRQFDSDLFVPDARSFRAAVLLKLDETEILEFLQIAMDLLDVAALERAADLRMDKHTGENVAYVVVDDEKTSRERVRLASEDGREGEYDVGFYRDLTVRAAESVLSPFGWRRLDIEQYLADREDAVLSAY